MTLRDRVFCGHELGWAREALRLFRDRDEPLPAAFYEGLEERRALAVNEGDETGANATWCLRTLGRAQDHFSEAFRKLRLDEFYKGWCDLEQCELALGGLLRHLGESTEEYAYAHMVAHVPRFQDLFPYRLFLSPGYAIGLQECTICGEEMTPRGGCDHRVHNLYEGRMCARIVKDLDILEVSLVERPVNKYAVAFPQGVPYNYGAVKYVVEGLRSPWDGWSYERMLRDTEDALYPDANRNDRCPCGSRKKYKRCCIGRTTRKEHLEVTWAVAPPSTLPNYVEDMRYEVDDGPGHSKESDERTSDN